MTRSAPVPWPSMYTDCSVCTHDYTPTLEYVCNECSYSEGRLALVVVISVLSVAAFAVFVSFMVSEEWEDARHGIVARIAPYLPLQSLKIIVVAWQILTQVRVHMYAFIRKQIAVGMCCFQNRRSREESADSTLHHVLNPIPNANLVVTSLYKCSFPKWRTPPTPAFTKHFWTV